MLAQLTLSCSKKSVSEDNNTSPQVSYPYGEGNGQIQLYALHSPQSNRYPMVLSLNNITVGTLAGPAFSVPECQTTTTPSNVIKIAKPAGSYFIRGVSPNGTTTSVTIQVEVNSCFLVNMN